ncbi:hypothetical protein DKP78_20145, partial [Enterococcus faecium]
MSSLGDFQKRMLAIVTEAESQGHKINDVVPSEVQEHFQDLKDLRTAKDYIKEYDEREKKYQYQIEDLEKQLKDAKTAVESLPDDHKQL